MWLPECVLGVNNRVTKGVPEVYVPECGRQRVRGFGVTSGGGGWQTSLGGNTEETWSFRYVRDFS